jgi:5-methylcytosine-specific restriction protein B
MHEQSRECTETNANKHQHALIAVGADWTSNENLLGFPDALNLGHYRKPDNGALDLILRAQQDPEHPYFLILDEMNLSHVERYFADFLSAMESGEAVNLHDDTGTDWDGVPAKLTIPRNLFVIGTVNVDETTYMFSPKVLDRANVIEFRVSDTEMSGFLAKPAKPDLALLAGKGASFAAEFVKAAGQNNVELDEDTRDAVSKVLMEFFPPLQKAGAEFGYRTAHEICRFVYFYRQAAGDAFELDKALDAAIMQKLLPKLHGAKKKLGPVLDVLAGLCLNDELRARSVVAKPDELVRANARYGNALEKILRMQARLGEHGFASFAEA